MNEQHVEGRIESPPILHIDPSLRAKYDVRGPRYTSYPPANHFGSIDLEALLERWSLRAELESDPGLSLYVHTPFCRSRCLFCGCHSFVCSNAAEHEGYVEVLSEEMKMAVGAVGRRTVRQLSIGGGTPNALDHPVLAKLLTALDETFEIASDAERSIELDPRTVSPEQLDLLMDHGFNRFSLGVQDFSKEVLTIVRRRQGRSDVESVVERLIRGGHERINFDLIYGLPGQNVETARRTAATVLSLRPSRVALYSYAHVPWIRPHQSSLEQAGIPSGELKAALFFAMAEKLLDGGYVAIGLDHFALPHDPLALALSDGTLRRNFMGYTTGRGLDVLGIGTSAISSIGSSYSQNEKGLLQYLLKVRTNRFPVFRGFLLSQDDELRRELLQQLSCTLSIDLHHLSHRLGIDVEEALSEELGQLNVFVNDGLVQREGSVIGVTERGRPFLRNICMVFDQYLKRESGAPQYSRTI